MWAELVNAGTDHTNRNSINSPERQRSNYISKATRYPSIRTVIDMDSKTIDLAKDKTISNPVAMHCHSKCQERIAIIDYSDGDSGSDGIDDSYYADDEGNDSSSVVSEQVSIQSISSDSKYAKKRLFLPLVSLSLSASASQLTSPSPSSSFIYQAKIPAESIRQRFGDFEICDRGDQRIGDRLNMNPFGSSSSSPIRVSNSVLNKLIKDTLDESTPLKGKIKIGLEALNKINYSNGQENKVTDVLACDVNGEQEITNSGSQIDESYLNYKRIANPPPLMNWQVVEYQVVTPCPSFRKSKAIKLVDGGLAHKDSAYYDAKECKLRLEHLESYSQKERELSYTLTPHGGNEREQSMVQLSYEQLDDQENQSYYRVNQEFTSAYDIQDSIKLRKASYETSYFSQKHHSASNTSPFIGRQDGKNDEPRDSGITKRSKSGIPKFGSRLRFAYAKKEQSGGEGEAGANGGKDKPPSPYTTGQPYSTKFNDNINKHRHSHSLKNHSKIFYSGMESIRQCLGRSHVERQPPDNTSSTRKEPTVPKQEDQKDTRYGSHDNVINDTLNRIHLDLFRESKDMSGFSLPSDQLPGIPRQDTKCGIIDYGNGKKDHVPLSGDTKLDHEKKQSDGGISNVWSTMYDKLHYTFSRGAPNFESMAVPENDTEKDKNKESQGDGTTNGFNLYVNPDSNLWSQEEGGSPIDTKGDRPPAVAECLKKGDKSSKIKDKLAEIWRSYKKN